MFLYSRVHWFLWTPERSFLPFVVQGVGTEAETAIDRRMRELAEQNEEVKKLSLQKKQLEKKLAEVQGLHEAGGDGGESDSTTRSAA